MARNKRNRKEEFQIALNEFDDIKANKQRELMDLNFKVNAKYKNTKQKELAETIKKNRITIVTGSPGSGKTFITLKTALELLKDKNSKIGDIILTSPILESPVGFLKGSLEEKLLNYFQHYWDNIDKLVDKDVSKFLKSSNLINEKIIGFMRGSTFGRYDVDGTPIGSFCILDEVQNIYPKDVFTYLTRLGEESKIILSGDIEQCDLKLKNGEKTGLEDVMERLKDLDGVGFIHFTEDDIVRDPFLIEIMKRYKK